MEKATFSYVDGTWEIEKGTYIDVCNYYDDFSRDWSKTDYLELKPNNSSAVFKIPKTHQNGA
jgi:hypothetical protein